MTDGSIVENGNRNENGNGKQPQRKGKGYIPSIERLRIILMFFMCIDLFGAPTVFGSFIQTFCGFVPIAFFMVSGFLVLRETQDRSARIVRAIKRTATAFAIMLALYFAINYFYYRLIGVNILPALKLPRLWFNFLVMNVWPFEIGSAIWYVQALLYAYIIIYFLDKWNLLKHDWKIAAVLILITVLTGELAGVIKWNVAGYTYIPGNFLTRALPYVLLGGFIRKKRKILSDIRRRYYIGGIVLGIILMFGEILLLASQGVPGYYGHLIGMPVTAFSVCMLAFHNDALVPGFEEPLGMSRRHVNCIYYLCQPMSIVIVTLLAIVNRNLVNELSGIISIITFAVCFGISWLIFFISGLFIKEK